MSQFFFFFFALPGTILLDCVNMAVEAGKVTPRDARCVSRLESMFPELQPRNQVFDALQRAKFDVSGVQASLGRFPLRPPARVICRPRLQEVGLFGNLLGGRRRAGQVVNFPPN